MRFSKVKYQGQVIGKFKNFAQNEVLRLYQKDGLFYVMSWDLVTGLVRLIDGPALLENSNLPANDLGKVLLIDITAQEFEHIATVNQLTSKFGANFNNFVQPSTMEIPTGFLEAQEDIFGNETILKLTAHSSRLQKLLKANKIAFPAFK